VVVLSVIAPYAESRRLARDLVAPAGTFVEVHVAAPLDVCVRRDTKGLYAKAIAGEIENFTGISAPYEEPLDPELRLDTSSETPAESAARVLAYLADVGI
jgi:adenylylsulfate kinase